MAVRRLALVPVVIVASLLLQGCPRGTAVLLYNNTTDDLLVSAQDGELVQWQSKASLRFTSEDNQLGNAQTTRGTLVPLLELKGDGGSRYFLLSFYGLPDDYVGAAPGAAFTSGTLQYRLQLEADGKLYIVKRGFSLPATELDPQPPGFPIEASKANVDPVRVD